MILMKTEFTEVSETRKNLSFEVPSDVVKAEIERVARGYSRTARVPGFRQGKVPATVVKQRYKDQILYDVAQDLIPRVVHDALHERGLEPVATPDIRDVVHRGRSAADLRGGFRNGATDRSGRIRRV